MAFFKIRYHGSDQVPCTGLPVLQSMPDQLFQLCSEKGGVGFARPGFHDLGMMRRHQVLQFMKQFLMDFFALPKPDKGNAYFLSWLISSQQDQLFCEVEYLHRLAHIEYEDLSAFTHHAGFYHQPAGLRNGHEIPGNLRMSDRNRTAIQYLPDEQGYYRARGTQHIPESGRNELCVSGHSGQ